MRSLLLLSLLASLAACGQTGALYLPGNEANQPAAIAPVDTATAVDTVEGQ